MNPKLASAVLAALALTLFAGCTANTAGGTGAGGSDARTIDVSSTADTCEVSASEAPSGNVVFKVTNEADQVTEFYLYAEDGLRIVGEVENIGPGLSRDLVVNLPPGTYESACKPNMAGNGIRAPFTVTDSGHDKTVTGAPTELIDAATRQYAGYVRDQTSALVETTRGFVAAYKTGNDDRARELYPLARLPWERIEPVAESFGDLDPKMDLREADMAEGQKWTGWHRLEKDLWPPKRAAYEPLSQRQRVAFADRLMRDTLTLSRRAGDLSFTVDQIGNGAKSLLDEVATTKITGEEEAWSHTDLYDFQANLDGARVAFEGLRPVLEIKDPRLERQIAARFEDLQKLLDQYRVGEEDFVSYTLLGGAELRELSDAVNALSEPLSKLAGAVTL